MKKIHISLSPESYFAIRELAFYTKSSISAVIDVLIDEKLIQPELRHRTSDQTDKNRS
jgi:hypothetical protein